MFLKEGNYERNHVTTQKSKNTISVLELHCMAFRMHVAGSKTIRLERSNNNKAQNQSPDTLCRSTSVSLIQQYILKLECDIPLIFHQCLCSISISWKLKLSAMCSKFGQVSVRDHPRWSTLQGTSDEFCRIGLYHDL